MMLPKSWIVSAALVVNLTAAAAPANENTAAATETLPKISFVSGKSWSAPRWFVVGQWINSTTLQWLDGTRSRVAFDRGQCTRNDEFSKIVRESGDVTHDVLAAKEWVAIEVDPKLNNERFKAVSPHSSDDSTCEGNLELRYAWTVNSQGSKPMLFLGPTNNRFFGHQVDIEVPDIGGRADIQLDVMLGVWIAKFPNVTAGGNGTLIMAPTGIARGEMLLPFFKSMGLTLRLEQTLANFGGVTDQSVLYSDWDGGIFYQKTLPVLDGILLRGSMKYREHLADDTLAVPTVASPNKYGRYLTFGFTTGIYFARRFLLGGDIEYGFPNQFSNRGASQSYQLYLGRAGVRVGGFIVILGEAGLQFYSATGFATESTYRAQAGVRLEL